ncbi:putative signal peptide-containing protein [Cryptosporidium canis]|uniref:Signal peptide-containing protein n=1 Tax=Cryptosporidium canis TaxID=195482 RepID=A0A9D5HVC5_9CRYT|nr:putative signal peptide-containing protein [Cryptosporidium canis]
MYLKVLFLTCVTFCLIDSRSASNSLFKTSVIHEVEEPINGERHTARDSKASRSACSDQTLNRVRPFNYCRALSRKTRSKYHWGDVSTAWQKRFRRFGYWVCFRDCGGGGDCLYKSIISSLNLRNTSVSALRTLIADQFVGINTTSIHNGYASTQQSSGIKIIDEKGNIVNATIPANSSHVDSDLRQNSTELFSSWNEVAFIERMNILLTMEAVGEWQDTWSPNRILNNDSLDGVDISTSQKKALFVHRQLSRTGNTHWGNEWDVNYIETIFKVKVLILWKNRGIFYPTLGNETSFNRVVLIYYDDQIGHFQVVGIKKMNSRQESDLVSVFKREEIPTSLKRLYKDDTNHDLS